MSVCVYVSLERHAYVRVRLRVTTVTFYVYVNTIMFDIWKTINTHHCRVVLDAGVCV